MVAYEQLSKALTHEEGIILTSASDNILSPSNWTRKYLPDLLIGILEVTNAVPSYLKLYTPT